MYKGRLTDGTSIAIRSLKAKRKHSIHTYTHQLELNAKLRHSYLVSAIGHCFECHQDDTSVSRVLLVFEYVPNGTLRKYISGKSQWNISILWSLSLFGLLGPQILVFLTSTSWTDGQPGHKFTWTQRIAAGIGVARGIQFLHTGIVPGVYSNHLKITDILLDHDLHVKINKYNLPVLTEIAPHCGSKQKSGRM